MQRAIHISQILLIYIIGAFILSFCKLNSAMADSEVDFSLNVSDTVLELNFSANVVSLNLTPVDSNPAFDSKNITVIVGTNNPTGYSLSMSTSSNTTVLTRSEALADNSTPTIAAIPAIEGGYSNESFISSNDTINKWGYKLSASGYLPFTGSSVSLGQSGGPTNGTSTTINFGAKVDSSQPAGNYTVGVNFAVVANPVVYHTITWDNNYSGSNVGANIARGVLASETVTLPSTPTAPTTQCGGSNCFTSFKEWNTKADGTGNTVTSSTIPTADTTYYAIWNFNSNTLQGMTTCPTNATTYYDARDGEGYMIQKLADGNCWLLDNLRLGGNTAISIKAGDTNSETRETNRPAAANGVAVNGFTLPASGSWTSSSQNSYNVAYIAASGNINGGGTFDKNTEVTSYGTAAVNGKAKVGVYYNYCAASAGTWCYASSQPSSDPYTDTARDAAYDICPAGWRMPTGGAYNTTTGGGDYQNLYNKYSGASAGQAAAFRNALSTPLSGGFNSGSASAQGSDGYFWSSTYYDGNDMYDLYVYSSRVDPQGSNGRRTGRSVRCVRQ